MEEHRTTSDASSAALTAAPRGEPPPPPPLLPPQVEEHTPFAKLYRPGQSPLPSDEVAAAMYCTASTMLRGAGEGAWGRWRRGNRGKQRGDAMRGGEAGRSP